MMIDEQRNEFEKQALPHLNALYSYAVRLCYNNKEDAEDLVQETMIKGFRFFHQFEQGTNCKAWMFRILKNTYINKYRKDSKEPSTIDYSEIEEYYDSIRDMSTSSNNVEREIFSSVLSDEVQKAMDTLPDDFRTVIILCDIEDFSYQEIAEFLDCPIGTVRSRLHRARILLAQKLSSYARNIGYINNPDVTTT